MKKTDHQNQNKMFNKMMMIHLMNSMHLVKNQNQNQNEFSLKKKMMMIKKKKKKKSHRNLEMFLCQKMDKRKLLSVINAKVFWTK